MALHGGKDCWQRRGRCTAPSSSSPSTTAASVSPCPSSIVAGSATAGSWGGATHCRAETLAATDEASACPLAMTEGRKEQAWGQADGEGLRGATPSRSLPYKGTGSGLDGPSQPIRLIKVTAGKDIDRPPRPIEGVWGSTHARSSSRIPRACHSPCVVHAAYVARGKGVMGRVEQRFPGKENK